MKKTALHLCFLLAAIWANAQTNQYLHFDKVDDYVEVPNASSLIANSNQISMAGWFYHDELSYGQGLMSFRGGGSGTGEMYLIQLNNGTMECRLITTAGFHEVVAPQFTIAPQTWQHIAWVYDGSMVRLFLNGTQIGSKEASRHHHEHQPTIYHRQMRAWAASISSSGAGPTRFRFGTKPSLPKRFRA
ncbi:MAG: LamG domain-containing protein [Saprospiraceae bacterium]|nr:LamG domain-containing protein [Saprospiraceae bacterium]